MKIYLDTCCYNRPFDDQKQSKIRAEANAIENIIKMSQWRGYTIFNSIVLDKEISEIKINNPGKYADVFDFYSRTTTMRAILKKNVFGNYATLALQAGIKKKDTAHLCYAISALADYLITTDKGFIAGAAKIRLPLRVINPLNFPLGGKI